MKFITQLAGLMKLFVIIHVSAYCKEYKCAFGVWVWQARCIMVKVKSGKSCELASNSYRYVLYNKQLNETTFPSVSLYEDSYTSYVS